MTGRSLTGVATLVFLAAAGVGAADKWDKRPYNTWTDLELKEVLTGSPWAGNANVTRVASNGGNSQPLEEVVLVSWASGLPLRQAGVREQIKVNTPIPAEVDAALAKPTEMYVLTMKVTGGSGASYANQAAAIQAETSLLRNGKPPLKPTAVEGRTLDKTGKPVQAPAGGFGPGRGGGGRPGGPPGGAPGGGAPGGGGGFEVPAGGGAPPSQSVQQSVPGIGGAQQAPALAAQGGGGGGGRGGGGGFGGGGAGGGAASLLIFAFPKTEALTLADKEVEFVSKLCGGGGFGGGGGGGGGGGRAGGAPASPCNLNVKKKFKMKDMQYMGELAL